jgi:hypothetical protein
MSSVIISGDTSGSITLAAPAVAGTNTITLPASTGTMLTTTSPKTGNVLQVIQGDLSSSFSTSSSTATDTGLSATITPSSSSSKILVFLDSHGGQNTTGRSCFYILVRGSTTIKSSDNLQTGTTFSNMPMTLVQLDSPSTASAVTYKIQMRTDGVGTVAMTSSGTQISSLILMEIAG